MSAHRERLQAMRLAVKKLCWRNRRLYVLRGCHLVHVAQMFPTLYQECLQEAAILVNRLELERRRLTAQETWGGGLASENADYPILPSLLKLGFSFS
jgi:hypothetical protein